MKKITKKIDKFINEKISFINELSTFGIIYIFGSAIIKIIDGQKISEVDLIILTQKQIKLDRYFKKYNLKYNKKENETTYLLFVSNININIYVTNDLLDIDIKNDELIYYDINYHALMPLGSLELLKYNKKADKEYLKNLKSFRKNILRIYK